MKILWRPYYLRLFMLSSTPFVYETKFVYEEDVRCYFNFLQFYFLFPN